jgi:hypothetical protein
LVQLSRDLAVQVVGNANDDEVDLLQIEQGAIIGDKVGDLSFRREPLGATPDGVASAITSAPFTTRRAS